MIAKIIKFILGLIFTASGTILLLSAFLYYIEMDHLTQMQFIKEKYLFIIFGNIFLCVGILYYDYFGVFKKPF